MDEMVTECNNDDEDVDPFDVFGPSLASGGEAERQHIRQQRRDPANGFNSHHPGTELAMLQFVRNGMTKASNENLVDHAIRLVDQFCYQRHWMMHVGVSLNFLSMVWSIS